MLLEKRIKKNSNIEERWMLIIIFGRNRGPVTGRMHANDLYGDDHEQHNELHVKVRSE